MIKFVALWIIALYILMQNELSEEGEGSESDMHYRAKYMFQRFIFLNTKYDKEW
jgi:hypothetical protein